MDKVLFTGVGLTILKPGCLNTEIEQLSKLLHMLIAGILSTGLESLHRQWKEARMIHVVMTEESESLV